MNEQNAKTVLVVDDNPPSRYAVSRVLRHAGFKTTEVATGEEALTAVRTKTPDLLLLDINLPDLNGFEVTQQIRSDPTISQTPILMLSATYLDDESRVYGLSSGADGYLTHPVEPPVLLAYVKALLRTRQAEEKAVATAAQWQATFDALSNGICVTGPSGQIHRCNQALVDILGIPIEAIIGFSCEEVLGVVWPTPADAPQLHEEIELLRNGRYLHITYDPVLDDSDQLIGLIHIVTDITTRKQTEEALLSSEEKFRQIVETAQEGIWVIDEKSKTTFVNDRMAEMLGYTIDEMLGQPLFTFMSEEAIDLAQVNVERRRQGIREQHEFVFERKDGTPLWAYMSTNPILGRDNNYLGAQAMVTDVSDLKQMQQAEHEQRVFAEALSATANALISALDLDSVMNTIVEGVGRVVPHDAVNIMLIDGELARPVYWQNYDPDRDEFLRHLQLVVRETQPLHKMTETGTAFLASHTAQYADWAHSSWPEWAYSSWPEWVKSYVAAPIRSHGEVIGFLNLESSTPGLFTEDHARRLQTLADQASIAIEHAQLYEEIQRHANELEKGIEERTNELNRSLNHIAAILNSSSDLIILCHTDGTISQVNPSFEETFRMGSDDALLQPLRSFVIPEQAARIDQAFQKIITTRQPQRFEITVQHERIAGFDADVVLSPILEQENQIAEVVCSLRDISERKQMENQLRKMLEHEIELSELKSRYLAMAAHDLRNPLAVIQSASGLIRHYGDRLTEQRLQEKHDKIRHSIQIMVELLDDILTLGRVESGKLSFLPNQLDVIAFCKIIIAEIRQVVGVPRTIDLICEGDSRKGLIDAKLLRHILGNLLSNALKYSPEDHPVTLTVQYEPEQIVFFVQDQGIGIPENDQKRLFESFFRADNTRQFPGTGLGLAIVKQSVELHGGTITFESEESVGTTFVVALPQSLGANNEENPGH
jgi:PAS domain S-box-containing protein